MMQKQQKKKNIQKVEIEFRTVLKEVEVGLLKRLNEGKEKGKLAAA